MRRQFRPVKSEKHLLKERHGWKSIQKGVRGLQAPTPNWVPTLGSVRAFKSSRSIIYFFLAPHRIQAKRCRRHGSEFAYTTRCRFLKLCNIYWDNFINTSTIYHINMDVFMYKRNKKCKLLITVVTV
jgi:hypothetical protein